MGFCHYCQAQIRDTAIYCPRCGTKQGERRPGMSDGPLFSAERFIPRPAASDTDNLPAAPAVFPLPNGSPDAASLAGPLPAAPARGRRRALIALLCTAAVAVVAVASVLTIRALLPPNRVTVYLKNNTIMAMSLKHREPVARMETMSGESTMHYSISISMMQLSDDGNRLFYLENTNGASFARLRCRRMDSKSADPVTLARSASQFMIRGDGRQVAYISETDNALCTVDVNRPEEERVIEKDVQSFMAEPRFRWIWYVNEDNALYLYKNGSSRKIADNANLSSISRDFFRIFYTEDNTLYRQSADSSPPEAIDDNVQLVLIQYDNGSLYYMKSDSTSELLSDYLVDDMASYDDSYYPERGTVEYDEWQLRNSIRERLSYETVNRNRQSLHFYDGREAAVVSGSLLRLLDFSRSDPVAVFLERVQSPPETMRMSEITSEMDLYTLLYGNQDYSGGSLYLAVDGEAERMNLDFSVASGLFVGDGAALYLLGDEKIYTASLRGRGLSEPSLVDTEVNDLLLRVSDYRYLNQPKYTVPYVKNQGSNGEADLYVDGQEFDRGVRIRSLVSVPDSKALFYSTYDADNSAKYMYNQLPGSLKKYKNGKLTTIAEDILNFSVYDEDTILVTFATSETDSSLYLFEDGQKTLLDDEVVYMAPLVGISETLEQSLSAMYWYYLY